MSFRVNVVVLITLFGAVKAAIEMPLGGDCRHNARIEGLYDIVFKSQRAGKYKPNTECVITIEAPRHHGLHLEFTHMDLQLRNADGECSDYIQIVELQGSERTPHTLTDKLCGTKHVGPFDTPYSYLEILFQSDNFVEKSGFKFFFTRTDGPTNVDNELVNAATTLHNTGLILCLSLVLVHVLA